ncbi:hypothetical protein VPH35_033470 [Triticum aestivum]
MARVVRVGGAGGAAAGDGGHGVAAPQLLRLGRRLPHAPLRRLRRPRRPPRRGAVQGADARHPRGGAGRRGGRLAPDSGGVVVVVFFFFFFFLFLLGEEGEGAATARPRLVGATTARPRLVGATCVAWRSVQELRPGGRAGGVGVRVRAREYMCAQVVLVPAVVGAEGRHRGVDCRGGAAGPRPPHRGQLRRLPRRALTRWRRRAALPGPQAGPAGRDGADQGGRRQGHVHERGARPRHPRHVPSARAQAPEARSDMRARDQHNRKVRGGRLPDPRQRRAVGRDLQQGGLRRGQAMPGRREPHQSSCSCGWEQRQRAGGFPGGRAPVLPCSGPPREAGPREGELR